jgi:hypothetical protein
MSEAPNPLDTRNAGKEWTDNEVKRLRNLGIGNQPMRLIVRELGRPEREIRSKAEEMGFAVESDNYNRFMILDEDQQAQA